MKYVKGNLTNFAVGGHGGVLFVIQAPDIETATARIPVVMDTLGMRPAVRELEKLQVVRHRGFVRRPWYGDRFFLMRSGMK